MFCLGGVLKLFGDITGLVGPLSIVYIVNYIEAQTNKSIVSTTQVSSIYNNQTIEHFVLESHSFDIDYPDWQDLLQNGWIISIMVLIFAIAQGTLSQASTHLVNMEGIKLRNALQGLVYRKTMLLTLNCIANSTSSNINHSNNNQEHKNSHLNGKLLSRKSFSQDLIDDDETDVGNITNLMSEDSFNVMSFFWIAHYIWAIPLKIAIVMYFLYQQLGVSAIYGSLICIVTMTPLQFLIGKMMSNNAKKGTVCE